MTLKRELELAAEICQSYLDDLHKVPERSCGLCGNLRDGMEQVLGVSSVSRAFYYLLAQVLREWPDGTGKPDFPVPAPYSGDSGAAQAHYYAAEDMWHPATEYGMSRLRLTKYAAERFAALASELD